MKDQKALLRKVAAELLSVKRMEHLAGILSTTLKLETGYAEAAIFLLDTDNNLLRNVLGTHYPGQAVCLFQNEIQLKELTTEEILLTGSQDGLGEFCLDDAARRLLFRHYLSAAPAAGASVLVFPMREGNDFIGNLFLFFDAPLPAAQDDTDLFKMLIPNINMALLLLLWQERASVQGKEQLQSCVAQLNMLIALGTRIASARSHDELLEVINQHLKEVVGFAYTMMAVNGDQSSASTYVLDPNSAGLQQMDHPQLTAGRHAIVDGFLDKVLQSDDPLIFDLEKLIALRPLPGYLKTNYDNGIRQVVMTKFRKGKEAFGFWILTFDHTRTIAVTTLQIIHDVAMQLSVSVHNMLINLEYERRERERSRLMQFSNAIASIRDKGKLAKTIKEHLQDLFHIGDFMLWSLSRDHHHRTPVLFDCDSAFARHSAFQHYPADYFKNDDGIYNVILASSGVSYFNADDLDAAYAGHPYFAEIIETSDIVAMGGNVLRVGDEIVGILTFSTHQPHFVREKEELYLSICSQLAIVASNMFATDKISEQLAEISRFKERLEDEKIYLQEELETSIHTSDMIGSSVGMKAVHTLIGQVAYTDSTVLILGETGTGKELVARSVHNNSPRKSRLMVKVNCAALPANLIESELFGHEKGSFTGASERRLGKFELANHGTLFLDEIGELPLDLQGKLLRALQEKEIERIGGKSVIKVDVRVIAATNRNLEKEVATGRFRSDLYYRINIFPIRLPALRDRISDIPLLAGHFISKYATKAGKQIGSLSGHVLRELQRYNWPGNIRELEHIIERSVLLTKGDTLKAVDIPTADSDMHDESMYLEKKIKTIDENERDHIIRILKICRGRINGHHGAAVLLGIPPSTLNSKMKRLDIRKQDIRP
ncbi:Fis family transcriptional regulator [Dyadobacter beijingensis]|uniref:Fis family transcriptional regulator n=1 Tax=Dyadobacter beijingensis TaxID=365489 RepID=A0ABQ2IL94_9BACT|nr:sigma 54-interacting transcriptional regulator [Dyadobacter beijingensis]GGN12254.1 Fis family transcriptional regulator [Dyadobacter beijingensis]